MDASLSISPTKDLFPFVDRSAGINTPVTLTRVIKGLGFNHLASVVEVDAEYMVVQTPQIHLYASMEGQCYLQNPSFPAPVRARLFDRNLARRLVVLSGFTYLKCGWVSRCQERAQPRIPTAVTVKCEQKTFNASVVDLNAFGMSLFVRKPLADEAGLAAGERVELTLRLLPMKPVEHIRGVVVNTGIVGGLLLRVGIRFQPEQGQPGIFTRYVAQRREEVLYELSQDYSRALEPRRVEDLYF
jgi:hypothetical protein